jgi:DNA-binding PucR family transcriptional regulator
LFIPFDESTAWVWFPFGGRAEIVRSTIENVVADAEADVFVALGEPLASLVGFRRTYQQAELARAVALASEPASKLTLFSDVAPISTMPSDLDTTRAWIAETLGALAVDDERAEVLRETARVFLAAGGSFTAAAQEMILHRNTAQYRIRKAEELRGRPLREGRLDVELALLACHYFGKSVLQPPHPEGEHR